MQETVQFYNLTKCYFDVAYQLPNGQAALDKAVTRRWTVAVFYIILDLAGINAFVP